MALMVLLLGFIDYRDAKMNIDMYGTKSYGIKENSSYTCICIQYKTN